MTPLAAALAAQASYTLPPTIAGTGVDQSIRAVITEVDGVKLVAFPGSDSFRKWFLDFKFQSHPLAGHPELDTEVHAGFLLGFVAIQAGLEQALGTEAWIAVGHSYGAAMALLAACLLPRPPLAVYCFAPPRVFADQVPAALLPITEAWRCGNDPVPDEPGWFVQVPLAPIGRSSRLPTDSHFMEKYVAALGG